MDNKKDELNEALGAFISRRKMIQMMGFGTAGATLLPSLLKNVRAQSPKSVVSPLSDFTPGPPIWNYTLPDPLLFAADPVFYNGTIIICTSNAHETGSIYSLDTQTREERWAKRLPFPSSQFGQPIIANGVIYVTNGFGENGQATVLYAIDADNGNILWQKNYNIKSSLGFGGGNLIFTIANGNVGYVIAVNPKMGGQLVWQNSFIINNEPISTPLIVGNTVFMRLQRNIIAINLVNGDTLWETDVVYNTQNTDESFDISVGNGNVYFTNRDGNLHALDIVTGNPKWKSCVNPNNCFYGELSAPVFYNEKVYVSNGGRLFIFQADTGNLINAVTVSEDGTLNLTLFIEDGIAYLTAFASQKAKFYAVDLSSPGPDIVSYDPSTNGYIFGLETGVCYCQIAGSNGENQIIAIDLANLVHQFFAESELMVEDYDTSTGKPSTTSYRTHIQLFDPNKNPRLLKSIKVWASELVTITSGGKTYNIDTNKSAWLMTDTAGELSIVSTAESFTSPALYLWGNFMELNEAIVIYPDHDTLNKLSSVKSQDLTSAKTYDGSPLLPTNFTGADALASVISNTVGAHAAAVAATRRQFATSNRYIFKRGNSLQFTTSKYEAYPGSSPNLLYQKVAGSSDRTYVAGNVKQWHAVFGADGSVTFNLGLPTTEFKLLSPESFLGIKEFFDKVVKGAAKIVHIALDAVGAAVHTIYDDAKNAYRFVVNSVEDAAKVLAGIFKTVLGDLKKPVEWLSYVFDWDSILANKELIKNTALAGFTKLGTVVDNLIDKEIANVHTFFQNLEKTVVSDIQTIQETVVTDFTGATTPFGSKPLQSQQNAGNNPQLIYGMNGAKSYAKSRWLVSKFKENASQATISGSGTDADNLILTELQKFEKAVIAIIEDPKNGVQTISDELKQFLSDFSNLITNPSEFVEKSFNDILNIIADIAVLLLKVVDLVVEGLLELLKAVFDSLLNLVTQTIDIPFISALYKKISGADLSVLDLFCLMVAIPSTIILNAANAPTNNVRSLESESSGLEGYAIMLAGATYAFFDGLLDLFPTKLPYQLKLAPLTLSVMLQGMSLPDAIDSSSADFKLFYAAQAFPVLLTGTDLILSKLILSKAEIPKQLFDKEAPFALMAYGLGSLIASINLAIQNECGFRGKNYISMTQNIFTFIPYVCKPLGLGGDGSDTNIALGIIDFLCDTTAVGLEVAQVLHPNPECA
ncbi:MAG: PQQ-binding-like beta-propeller repeat protein [Pyrinomonadaceae bacterium]